MGDRAMELGEKEFERIEEFVRSHLKQWMGEVRRERELDLLERTVRVEEELKSLRELTVERFEALQTFMDERFGAVDKGFESVDKRFGAVDKRFESVDKRFESVDKRFEDMNRRFTSLQWTMGIGFTVLAALMGVFNFF